MHARMCKVIVGLCCVCFWFRVCFLMGKDKDKKNPPGKFSRGSRCSPIFSPNVWICVSIGGGRWEGVAGGVFVCAHSFLKKIIACRLPSFLFGGSSEFLGGGVGVFFRFLSFPKKKNLRLALLAGF